MKFILSPEMCQSLLGGTVIGHTLTFNDIAFDSRQVKPGSLFVALPGAHVDGHAFIEQALQQGAAALLVERPVPADVPQCIVSSTLVAFGRLAHWHAKTVLTCPVVGITGSCGKTTVRNMTAALLAPLGRGLVTRKNYNTEVGVPVTVFEAEHGVTHAVFEMGAKRIGDINYLTKIVRPDIGILSSVHAAHIKVFGSLDAIAQTKGEILESLSPQGIGIYPYGSPYSSLWKRQLGTSFGLTIGLDPKADISASNLRVTDSGTEFQCHTPNGTQTLVCPLVAEHNVYNTLAAVGAAMSLGVDPLSWASSLSALEPEQGRLQMKTGRQGLVVIDDTYNAIYQAVINAIDYLIQRPESHKTLILGDLAELGDNEVDQHKALGAEIRRRGIDSFIAVGALMQHTAQSHGNAQWYPTKEDVVAAGVLQKIQGCVLVKGSRRMRMEDIVHQLTVEEVAAC